MRATVAALPVDEVVGGGEEEGGGRQGGEGGGEVEVEEELLPLFISLPLILTSLRIDLALFTETKVPENVKN